VAAFSDPYKRNGTSTIFAALEVATGRLLAEHYQQRRREFLDFMNEVVAVYPDQDLHIILDNLNTHKPKNDRWLARHPRVSFHYTSTSASWLNQVEMWFNILSRQALAGGNFTSVRALRQRIADFIAAYNQRGAPFEWKKLSVKNRTPSPVASGLRK